MISNIQNFQSLSLLYTNQNKSYTEKFSPLEKKKMNIESQIQKITNDKTLSEEEKIQKIQALQESLDGIKEQIGKQEFEEMKNLGQKLADQMQEDVEKETDEVQKEKKAQIAMSYGLIASNGEISKQRTLNYQRKRAVMEEGEDSARVKRINSMLEESTKTSMAFSYLASKAAAEYAKANKKNEENELETKLVEDKKDVQQPEKESITDEKLVISNSQEEVGEKTLNESKDIKIKSEPNKISKKPDFKPHNVIKEKKSENLISFKVKSYMKISVQKAVKLDIAG